MPNEKFGRIVLEIPLNINKLNKNGFIYTEETYESASKYGLNNLPFTMNDKDGKAIPIGVVDGRIVNNKLLIDGYIWVDRYCNIEHIVKNFSHEDNIVNNMEIAGISINLNE